MRVIKVYGSLAKFLGQRSFKAAVNTPAEAVRFLIANFPGIREHMADKHYKVGIGKSDLAIADCPEQLHYPTGTGDVIRIVPVIGGAKRGGALQIVLGVALIALSFVSFGAGAWAGIGGFAGAAGTTAAWTAAGSMLAFTTGVSFLLGGVAQLLTPVPKISGTETDPSKSYSFSGIQNVSRQGVPVPIVYGECLVGSVVISAGINTEDI
jgi:hypothetical protein